MSKKILLSMILGFGLFIAHDTSFAALDTIDIVTNCDGTQITRTAVGKIEITHGAIDLPGCVGKSILTGSGVQGNASSVSTGMIQDTVVTTSSTAIDGTGTIQTNCNGIQITRALSGKVMIARVEKNLPGCTNTNMINSGSINVQKYNPERGPALDIRSTDIVNYRTLQMKNK